MSNHCTPTFVTLKQSKQPKHTLDRHRVDDASVTINDNVRLLALVLRCNNFKFNNSHYLQMQGVAMGTRAAPTVANLVVGEFEVKWVYIYDLQPILWVRYIDNIFHIWAHGVTSLKRFIHHHNSVYPTLKFTALWSEHQITVLDVLIKLNQTGP